MTAGLNSQICLFLIICDGYSDVQNPESVDIRFHQMNKPSSMRRYLQRSGGLNCIAEATQEILVETWRTGYFTTQSHCGTYHNLTLSRDRSALKRTVMGEGRKLIARPAAMNSNNVTAKSGNTNTNETLSRSRLRLPVSENFFFFDMCPRNLYFNINPAEDYGCMDSEHQAGIRFVPGVILWRSRIWIQIRPLWLSTLISYLAQHVPLSGSGEQGTDSWMLKWIVYSHVLKSMQYFTRPVDDSSFQLFSPVPVLSSVPCSFILLLASIVPKVAYIRHALCTLGTSNQSFCSPNNPKATPRVCQALIHISGSPSIPLTCWCPNLYCLLGDMNILNLY